MLGLDLTRETTILPKGDRKFHSVSKAMRSPPPLPLPLCRCLLSRIAWIVNYNRENTAFRDIKRTGSRFK